MAHARLAVGAGVLAACGVVAAPPIIAQESLQISVPPLVVFQVADVSMDVIGSPDPAPVTFGNAMLISGNVVRLSVKAEGSLVGPSGVTIPAGLVSWTTSNASGGIGLNGELSSASYVMVFEGQLAATSGGVNVRWSLGGPSVMRAGDYTVTLRWKVESSAPLAAGPSLRSGGATMNAIVAASGR